MTPIAHIRKNVLKVSQSALGAVAGVDQATVSRWERSESEPTRAEMERIRDEALKANLPWDDSWFFVVPEAA